MVEYIVLSIVSMKLRRARATLGSCSEQVDIFLREDGSSIPDTPFSITINKMCKVEVCLNSASFWYIVNLLPVNV